MSPFFKSSFRRISPTNKKAALALPLISTESDTTTLSAKGSCESTSVDENQICTAAGEVDHLSNAEKLMTFWEMIATDPLEADSPSSLCLRSTEKPFPAIRISTTSLDKGISVSIVENSLPPNCVLFEQSLGIAEPVHTTVIMGNKPVIHDAVAIVLRDRAVRIIPRALTLQLGGALRSELCQVGLRIPSAIAQLLRWEISQPSTFTIVRKALCGAPMQDTAMTRIIARVHQSLFEDIAVVGDEAGHQPEYLLNVTSPTRLSTACATQNTRVSAEPTTLGHEESHPVRNSAPNQYTCPAYETFDFAEAKQVTIFNGLRTLVMNAREKVIHSKLTNHQKLKKSLRKVKRTVHNALKTFQRTMKTITVIHGPKSWKVYFGGLVWPMFEVVFVWAPEDEFMYGTEQPGYKW